MINPNPERDEAARKSAQMCGDGCCVSEPLQNGFISGWDAATAKAAERMARREEVIEDLVDKLSDCIHTLEQCRDRVCDVSWVKGSIEISNEALTRARSLLGGKDE